MKKKVILYSIISIMLVLVITGCSVASAFSPTATPSLTPLPTETPTPTVTPTATEIPFYVDAKVYLENLQVPILIYHRFVGDDALETSTSTKMRYSDFKAQLQALYDNGYSLVSLQDWMDGTFDVPIGRKPLIITLDDLWFADQLFLEDDGTPSIYSGIGILWAFSQEHPDFGFSAAGFSNMGDKKTADKHVEDYFFISDGDVWMDRLGLTMAWAIDNGVEPYNHLFDHPQLSKTDNTGIVWELKENDRVTRYYLSRVGRDDLIPKLGNMLALPYGEWPSTQRGIDIIKEYKNTEGKPMQAIFEAYNFDYGEQKLTPSIFSADFDPYVLSRIMATVDAVNWVIEQRDSIPSAQLCQLGPIEEEQAANLDVIQAAIQNAVASQVCPAGIYNVNGNVFVAKDGMVSLFKSAESEAVAVEATPTPEAAQ